MSVQPVSSESVEAAAELIRQGELVAFPTETVYGLGADALNPQAVQGIFHAKGRPAKNPLIVHVLDSTSAQDVVSAWPESAQLLAERFWPGPLTLVLPKADGVPDAVTANGPTVAVRAPAHPVARQLLAACKRVIAAPSANRSGQLSPTTAQHVEAEKLPNLKLILDGGPCPGGLESTVIDLTSAIPRLLRPGLIRAEQLRATLGSLEISPVQESDTLASPGLMNRHYAPHTALECAESRDELLFLKNLYETAGLKVGVYDWPDDPDEVARTLFAELHTLDRSGYDRLLTVMPPAVEEWHAIRDRLQRASAEE